ncbi:MAG: TlpA family protein disulfide reductase [Fibrobacteria bacterium]|nr:TlpA family protein disulfide reductase [Fibrobacteria bacterium]
MRLTSLLAALALTTACSNAESAPAKPAQNPPPAAQTVAAPTPAVAPAAPVTPTRPTTVDFAIPMMPVKQKDLSFEIFRNRWSLLFYFLPTCGHCQHTYPWIQELRASYEKKGLAFAAITSGSASAEDIQMFDTDFKLDMPAFTDVSRQFGSLYGTGSVPLILLVKPDGTYTSWTGSSDSTRAQILGAIKTGLHIK